MSASLVAPAGAIASSDDRKGGLRKDIQALRAFAVFLVVVYHFWPDRLPGGYIGVDVFFVISGFLITSHLIRKPPQNLRDLGYFWARRIRRLLPLSFLVIAVSGLAVLVLLPISTHISTAREAIASVVYLQNWYLADQSVDYLAEHSNPSVFQHFWSLSVEEQFYVVWPLLIVTAGVAARAHNKMTVKRSAFFAVSLVTLASFIYSVYAVHTNPSAAYFISPTRFWELGVGALLAFIAPLLVNKIEKLNYANAAIAWGSYIAMFIVAFIYTPETLFPGINALAPVVLTALIILVNADQSVAGPHVIGNRRIIQHLGDISYGVYLWHWPVLIIIPAVITTSYTWPLKILTIIAIFVIATVTKISVEDRFRHVTKNRAALLKTYLFLVTASFAFIAVSLYVITTVTEETKSEAEKVAEQLDDECFGAKSLYTNGCRWDTPATMSPQFALEDKPVVYDDGCWARSDFTNSPVCTYGTPKDSEVTVALVGNSHAGHWSPALIEIAEKRNWRLDTYLVSQCYTVVSPLIQFDTQEKSENCSEWNRNTLEKIKSEQYDVVIMSSRTWEPFVGMTREETWTRSIGSYKETIETIRATGSEVVVIRDTPFSEGEGIPQCLDRTRGDTIECNDLLVEAQDPLYDTAIAMNDSAVHGVDLTSFICPQGKCQSVIGGVIVFFDHGHLSATYVQTLTDKIEESLSLSLGGSYG